ncbi:5-oxoprolinase subunit PxpB [Polaribacter aquimarinus]|uniref:Allophanate hydrolase n=1 Tax=Polaribacter aquimarinus TaxID=2100726 RepID=A0A2U2J6X4_9FLAO|nr:5-oxoprolinase subunit PxpB [Polaribacter aquimarinus]PWG04086.1 allophanate hydrolase [Polaribacter aquimarinus]
MDRNITYKAIGNKVILVEWKPIISKNILNDILQFKYKIEYQKEIQCDDIIVAYNSLMIKYTKPFYNFDVEKDFLQLVYLSKIEVEKQQRFLWEIPVCYDEKYGLDLKEIASIKGMSSAKIIELHEETIYTVFFIGFLPGFLYLGGLDKQLFIDRKPKPRLRVETGSVAIGGQQTGVYPIGSPGGWNIIGKTPVLFFDANTNNPCFAKSGDKVRFKSISLSEYKEIQRKVERKSYQISKTLIE